jgi:integrase
MANQKQQPIVYDADGFKFTIYKTIKPTKAGPRLYWVLVDTTSTPSKRRLLNNKTLKAAQQRADEIKAAMLKGQANRMALSEGAWQDMCVARKIVLENDGDSLTAAAQEWADCRFRLPVAATLMDAVQVYVSQYRIGEPPPRPTGLVEAAERYHQFKVDAGKSESHCKNIQCRINRLVKDLPPGIRLDELTAGQLDAVVVGFRLKPKTMNEYRITMSSLYSWAAKQNPPLVPKSFNPGKDMERHKLKYGEVESLRVAALRTILVTVPGKRPDLVPLIALVCFAGLRPSEAVRLNWSEVGTDYIRLPGKKSKTGYSRQIPIQDNLKVWLALWRKNEGPICPGIDLSHLNTAIRRFSGVRLSHDCMRHGYGTNRQKILKNVGAVADEMGHTMQVCRRHYLNAFCTEKEAAEWFSLMPSTVSNIINLPTATEGQPAAVSNAVHKESKNQ